MAEAQAVSWPHVLASLISKRWWWVSILVLIGMGIMVRLGIWQLDRLEWRRGLNADISAQLTADPLVLSPETTTAEFEAIAFRQVTARGHYDLEGQFVLLQQNYNGQAGVFLFAPLLLEDDDRAILVNRGWLPADQDTAADWAAYDDTSLVEVTGFVQDSLKPPRVTLADYTNDVANPVQQWFWPYIAAIQQQYPYELFPAYIQVEPDLSEQPTLPFPVASEVDLSEGNHQSYAYQWFAFALTLGVIYLFLVRRQESSRSVEANESQAG